MNKRRKEKNFNHIKFWPYQVCMCVYSWNSALFDNNNKLCIVMVVPEQHILNAYFGSISNSSTKFQHSQETQYKLMYEERDVEKWDTIMIHVYNCIARTICVYVSGSAPYMHTLHLCVACDHAVSTLTLRFSRFHKVTNTKATCERTFICVWCVCECCVCALTAAHANCRCGLWVCFFNFCTTNNRSVLVCLCDWYKLVLFNSNSRPIEFCIRSYNKIKGKQRLRVKGFRPIKYFILKTILVIKSNYDEKFYFHCVIHHHELRVSNLDGVGVRSDFFCVLLLLSSIVLYVRSAMATRCRCILYCIDFFLDFLDKIARHQMHHHTQTHVFLFVLRIYTIKNTVLFVRLTRIP